MNPTPTPLEEIVKEAKRYFEANALDGDEVQGGQMVSSRFARTGKVKAMW